MNKMKEEYKDFVGIYDESVPVDLCKVFVNNWEEAKKNQTIIDCSVKNESGLIDNPNPQIKRDETAFVTPLASTIYPRPPVNAYFDFLTECFKRYIERYTIDFKGVLYNNIFKIHKVRKTEGYHIWHYERSTAESLDRIMVYMTYLEVPKKGGETEFLHQSLRIEPIVGRTLIWPAGFTHMHRGNPPLDGEKMYITGWFNSAMGQITMNMDAEEL
jgi:hypothetical protein